MALVRSHNPILEEIAAGHAGRVVKTIGDGYPSSFSDAGEGLRCAVSIQDRLGQRLADVRVRIGLHTGLPVREGSDSFGC